MFDEDAKAKAALYAAIFLTLLGYSGRLAGVEPLQSQFFPLAAWAYTLLADNLVYRLSGGSPLITRTGEVLVLALWSLALSAVFELLNLRLGAWYYTGQPATLSTRWTGLALGWAAFLPSLFVTSELLRCLGLFGRLKTPALTITPGVIYFFYASGAAMLLLPLALPRLAWPLIWGAGFFLAEPLNYRLGLGSLLREWEGGLPAKTLRMAAAGVVCGLLWSALNGAAGAKWGYSYPMKAGPELFGLPVFAYAGFGLFALAAYSLYALASWLRAGKTWEEGAWEIPGRRPESAVRYVAWLFFIITSYMALRAVDAHTIRLYIGWI
ncbi:MAG: hypothetical protein A2081_03790 [Elusimicrobia bacterium GWC2_61_19]|nr:MAG: hypothetical protein A2081_03790 [Elusimicrobia bacterium GWC2_61_19]